MPFYDVCFMLRFDSERNKSLIEYDQALRAKKIDERVIAVLEILNTHIDYFTTSSCSGRILLLAVDKPGAKSESTMIEKWHDKFTLNELKNGISNWTKFEYLYLLAQSPIFHISARDILSATNLRNIADSAGFKYSSIRSIKPITQKIKAKMGVVGAEDAEIRSRKYYQDLRITVELLSTERLNIPLGLNNEILVDDSYLNVIVDLANNSITESQNKVKRLEKVLRDKL
jgi:tRNA wybutosine-synthesizing protein 3